jgi:hypothetical protein
MTEPGTSQQQKAPRLNHAQATKLREYYDKGYELKNKKDLQEVVSEVGCTEHQAKSAWGRLRRAANQNKSQSAVEAGAPTGGVLRRPASLSKSVSSYVSPSRQILQPPVRLMLGATFASIDSSPADDVSGCVGC